MLVQSRGNRPLQKGKIMEHKIITNPVKAIRAKCLDCCCGSPYEVERCTVERCALYPFRMGKNPYRPERTPAQIEASKKAGERLRAARSKEQALTGAENETV